MPGTVGRGEAMTIEHRADKYEDLGKGDELPYENYDPSKRYRAAGNMGEDDGHEWENDVGELAEEAEVLLRDSEEDSEGPAEVHAKVYTIELVDELADQATDDSLDEERDNENNVA